MKQSVRWMAALGIALSVFITSCEKDRVEKGRITVRMKDAPADFGAVNVDLVSVQLKYVDDGTGPGGWVVLGTKTGVYNLLELQNEVTQVIAEDEIPAGRINQMRLILGFGNSLVVDRDTLDLDVPGEYNTGLKINVNDTIKAKETLNLTLDFNAKQSVVTEGGGSYLLKPVIDLSESYYTTK